MLKSDDFPKRHLKSLTQQIDNWLGDMIQNRRLPLSPKMEAEQTIDLDSFELGEQFLMVCLNNPQIHAVRSVDRDLGELVTLTRRRHHQLKYKKEAWAYARSRVDRNETLCQLFSTKLAVKIEEAIAALDKLENESHEFAEATWRVRLVTVPTFHTHAFLIQRVEDGSEVPVGESYIFVVSAPPWMEELPIQQLLRTGEFLRAFDSKTPIIGVPGTTDVTDDVTAAI
jgi:hypothetical protein